MKLQLLKKDLKNDSKNDLKNKLFYKKLKNRFVLKKNKFFKLFNFLIFINKKNLI